MSFGGASSSLKVTSDLFHHTVAAGWEDMTEQVFPERKEDEVNFNLRFRYKGTSPMQLCWHVT